MAERKRFDFLKIEIQENEVLKATYENFDTTKWDISPPGVKFIVPDGVEREIDRDIAKLNRGTLRGIDLEIFGEKLFRILFPDEIRKIFDEALNNIEYSEEKRGLRIVIEYPESSRIASWPLELLRRPRPSPIWLSTDERLSFSRKLYIGGKGGGGGRQPPLRIMLVVSSPRNKPPVMSGAVMESILEWAEKVQTDYTTGEQGSRAGRAESTAEEGADESARIEVKLLGKMPEFDRPPGKVYLNCTADNYNFKQVFNDWKPQVLHFIGHGDIKNGQGRLAFVNPKTEMDQWFSANELVNLINPEKSTLRLVVLQVCKSATSQTQLSLASQMVSLNIPAVVAMQFEIENHCAIEFSRHFYQSLAKKNDVDYAVQLARSHITLMQDPARKEPLEHRNREFCTPVIYTYKPGTIIESGPAKYSQAPGGPVAAWSAQQVTPDEQLKKYMDLADQLEKQLDALQKAQKGGGPMPGLRTTPPLAPESGPKTAKKPPSKAKIHG